MNTNRLTIKKVLDRFFEGRVEVLYGQLLSGPLARCPLQIFMDRKDCYLFAADEAGLSAIHAHRLMKATDSTEDKIGDPKTRNLRRAMLRRVRQQGTS